MHRLVAEYFIKKPSKLHDYVIHLDHSKTNNSVKNLKWVTYEEQRAHSAQSEASKANAKRLSQWSRITGKGKKLTEAKVKKIKEMLQSGKGKPNMKAIAEKFDITPMQLYRIRNGENWSWVEADGAKAAKAPAKAAAKAPAKAAPKPAAKAAKATPKKAAAKKAAKKK